MSASTLAPLLWLGVALALGPGCAGEVDLPDSGPDGLQEEDGGAVEDDGGAGEDDGATVEDDGATVEDDGGTTEDDGGTTEDDGGTTEDDGGEPGDEGAVQPTCPVSPCKVIDAFPYQDSDTTLGAPLDAFDGYACAAGVGEAGPEQVYYFELVEPGSLIAMLDDGEEVGADTDLHLLSAYDPQACLARGHKGLSRHLQPGAYFLVVDSWSDAAGVSHEGPYTLYAHLLTAASPCAMLGEPVARIGEAEPLAMPATGKVVKEAHLVTSQEFTDGSWPQSFTDGIQAHYALSEAASGYAMDRTEPWCPCCEPSNEYGQGSSARPPPEAEAFYVCMRWATAPPRGQRYLVFDGRTGRAVVAAAGYENGPGDLANLGGAIEEVHDHLGTGHLSVLTYGVAADQALPYGPIDCYP
ncbi:MAG TPA: hypothetical protein PK668_12095 [Myxococcota bacterium]|nr:hypothetical protein [Myxococcota bacterium]HRY93791.1 hypothetical protein [Myxococcota bacterium]HSA20467.1 hypothetical protein [Myxococcota bacterium]